MSSKLNCSSVVARSAVERRIDAVTPRNKSLDNICMPVSVVVEHVADRFFTLKIGELTACNSEYRGQVTRRWDTTSQINRGRLPFSRRLTTCPTSGETAKSRTLDDRSNP